MKNLFKAIAKFQSKVPAIYQDTKGYGYTYSSLAEITKVITPILAECNLGYLQPLEDNRIKTIIFETTSGEFIESSVEIPSDVSLKGMNQFQVLGSAITYLRRYSLSSMLGLITDKDLDASGEQVAKVVKATAPTPKPTPKLKKVPASDFPVVVKYAKESEENRRKALIGYDLTKKQREVLEAIVFDEIPF